MVGVITVSGIINLSILIVGLDHHVIGASLKADLGFLQFIGINAFNRGIPPFLTIAIRLEDECHGSIGDNAERARHIARVGGNKISLNGLLTVVNEELGRIQTHRPLITDSMVGATIVQIGSERIKGHLDFFLIVGWFESEGVIFVPLEPTLPVISRAV